MNRANILDIFQSIQGEGKYAGVSQVFVRFFECNMHCTWCDTPASIGDTSRNYTKYTHDEVITQIKNFWDDCHSVSLTGGEPLLQTEFIKTMLPALKAEKMPVYLETNGIFYNELSDIINDIDIIAMDIKMPSSTKCKDYWQEHEEFLKVSLMKDTFIKAVVSSDTDKQDIERTVDLISGIAPDMLFILQPNTYELGNGVMPKCVEFQKYCLDYLPNTRVLPQIHKFMKVP